MTQSNEKNVSSERNANTENDEISAIESSDSGGVIESSESIEAGDNLEAILEGAIIASSEPLSLSKLSSLFTEDPPSAETISTALRAIQQNCEGRGFKLVEVASGWRFQVREEFATWVNRLWEEKPQKYSRALLETLALIAYRQPITRGDIEEVRGVAVSSHIIKTLMERDWVKVIGHRDVPGRPALYATTRVFLDYFNLKSLDELPTLGELKDIDALDGDLDLGDPEGGGPLPQALSEALGEALPSTAELDESEEDEHDSEAQATSENATEELNLEEAITEGSPPDTGEPQVHDDGLEAEASSSESLPEEMDNSSHDALSEAVAEHEESVADDEPQR